ncbi:MAG: hypothetical protein R2932_16720 [Caldilineaceae bacterium]
MLTFVAAPDFEEAPTDAGANNVYDVQVTVSDGNGGTDVQDIAVTVTDVAENVAPVISSNGGGDGERPARPKTRRRLPRSPRRTVTATR